MGDEVGVGGVEGTVGVEEGEGFGVAKRGRSVGRGDDGWCLRSDFDIMEAEILMGLEVRSGRN